jgi:asparagine synthase (glutamine-hydrolysing)
MCGIAGVFYHTDPARPVDDRLVRAMTRALAHRGPDGEGVWTGAGIGLGHRRLAILDLSEHGRQPMMDQSGTRIISYNGEIYNFRELRAQLEAKGHRFRSSGDTEVVLAGYAEWGRHVVERLSGIFAFAIYDATQRALFLARDPLGVKPLFYALDDRSFRFASEIKAILLDSSIDREFDVEALDAFFTFSYTPAPATGFRHVRQLLPGQAAHVSQRGFETWHYWTSPFAERPATMEFDAALMEFGDRLDAATRAQMVSDVGVGAFLSGGLDSAALLRAMQRVEDTEVQALCVGFDVPGFDERPAARATAGALDVELTEIVMSVDAVDLVPVLSRHLEEPTADSSALPVYLLCQAAAERFKVALSGDGADELLAGYETYRASSLAALYRRIPRIIRRPVLTLLTGALPRRDAKYSARELIRRFAHGAELGRHLDHAAWRIIFSNGLKERVYAPDFLAYATGHLALERYAAHSRAVAESRPYLDGLLKADLEFYLPNDMLVKVDRMSMAHGLEVRVPFLDVEFVRFCANLPPDFKLHRGKVRKHILRESLRPSLPGSVLGAPKSGFNIPLPGWMRGDLSDLLLDTLTSRRVEASRFLRLTEVEAMVDEHRRRRDDHGYALFTVLMFALWLDNAASAWKLVG